MKTNKIDDVAEGFKAESGDKATDPFYIVDFLKLLTPHHAVRNLLLDRNAGQR